MRLNTGTQYRWPSEPAKRALAVPTLKLVLFPIPEELSVYATASVADAGTGQRGIMAVGHPCILRVTLTPQLRAATLIGRCLREPAWFTFVTVRRRPSRAPG